MITQEFIKNLAVKYQTIPENVAREYLQNLFLRSFYTRERAEKILFKGGTALRIVFGSPRFSEDLDFSAFDIGVRQIENLLTGTLVQLEIEERVQFTEAKQTTGGYLAKIKAMVGEKDIEIGVEISLRNKRKITGEIKIINTHYVPEYTLIILPKKILFEEKITACITRAKPRDFFDLYFLLRQESLSGHPAFPWSEIDQKLEAIDNRRMVRELKTLLPKSHHRLLPDFKQNLLKTLARFR